MIKVKQVIKNNILQTTPTQLFNSYEDVVTWLNTNLVNIFSYTGSAIATTSTTDKWIIDMHCLECDTTKDCLGLPKTAGTYELTVDANGNITRTPAVGAGTPFTCTDVTNCINTNTGTQTAINNLIRGLLNLPTAPGTYELVYNGTTYTWTTATGAGASFTCADVENCIRTNAGVQDAINDLLFGNGNTFCDKTEDCIRTDTGVQDAIKDLVFGNGNTTLCDAITAAGCSVGSSNAVPIAGGDICQAVPPQGSTEYISATDVMTSGIIGYIPGINPTADPSYDGNQVYFELNPTITGTYSLTFNLTRVGQPTAKERRFGSVSGTTFTELRSGAGISNIGNTTVTFNQALTTGTKYVMGLKFISTDYQSAQITGPGPNTICYSLGLSPSPSF